MIIYKIINKIVLDRDWDLYICAGNNIHLIQKNALVDDLVESYAFAEHKGEEVMLESYYRG